MNLDESSTTAAPPLLVLGDADAQACADGFCAVPPAPAGEPDGAGE